MDGGGVYGTISRVKFGDIAQLIRVLPWQGRGPGFESPYLHQGSFVKVCYNRTMKKITFSKIKLIKYLIILGTLILFASLISWCYFVYHSPKNVFDRMLATNLSLPAIGKRVIQEDNSQAMSQDIALMTQPVARVKSTSVLSRAADTTIRTESFGTPEADFVRYIDIKTGEKSVTGKAFDFSSVIGIWGKSTASDPESGGAQLFNQTLLGVIPMANLPKSARESLLGQIKSSSVYKIDTRKVKKNFVNGRLVYIYDASIQPEHYVNMLKSFARAMGLKQLEDVDPTQYADSAPLQVVLEVDALSSQLTKLTYRDSMRSEIYTAYGARIPFEVPTSSIPVNDLQDRLQQIR